MHSANGKIGKNFFIVDLDLCSPALFEKTAHVVPCPVVASAISANTGNWICAGDSAHYSPVIRGSFGASDLTSCYGVAEGCGVGVGVKRVTIVDSMRSRCAFCQLA